MAPQTGVKMKQAMRTALALGFRVLLLRPQSKKPLLKGVHDATNDARELRKQLGECRDANYGIATGTRVFAIDVDGKRGIRSLKRLEARHGPLPITPKVITANGCHLYFRADGIAVRNSASKIGLGIDVRGDGGYVVGPGSIHPSGHEYRFAKGRSFDEVDLAKAPRWLWSLIKGKPTKTPELTKPEIPERERDRANAYAQATLRLELNRLANAPRHQRNDTLNLCAFKLGQLLPYGLMDRQVLERELKDTAKAIQLDNDEIDATIRSGLDAGLLNPRRLPFLEADKAQHTDAVPGAPRKNVTRRLSQLGETDSDNAQRLAIRFAGEIIFVNGRGWFTYDGKRWRSAATHELFRHATRTARRIKNEVDHLADEAAKERRRKFVMTSLSKGALERMIELAKSHVAVEAEQLDSDPWQFNVENGTVDLRTGELELHDPRDLLTQLAPVQFDPRAKAPLFKAFLDRIAGGDKDLRIYIRNCVGYSLTGDTKEQVLFFCHGKSGRNGKSTFVNCVRDLLGDYGCHTPTETLMVKQYDNAISNDQARLVGKRMVTAIEANFSRQLDEAKLKAMTGGEKITARFMRQEYFEFQPAFKLWFAANDRPRVRSTDAALWRRIRVVPFNITIPEDQIDKDLPAKLRHEWPGILAWAVRGCLAWQKDGLVVPDAVKGAGSDWARESDHVKRFVTETLISEVGKDVGAAALHDHYSRWCHRNGETPLSLGNLKTVLGTAHNISHKRTKGGVRWLDISIK
jgi:putative DNA primase/helicase